MESNDSDPVNIVKLVMNNQTKTELHRSIPLKTYSKKSPDSGNDGKSRYGRMQKRNVNVDFLFTDNKVSQYLKTESVSRKHYFKGSPVKKEQQQMSQTPRPRGRPRKSLPNISFANPAVNTSLNISAPNILADLPDYQAPVPTSTATLPLSLELKQEEMLSEDSGCDDADWNCGDLAWASIGGFSYWPCAITKDPVEMKFKKSQVVGRSTVPIVMLHVRFFGDNGRRSWVKATRVMSFTGHDDYQAQVADFTTPECKKKDFKTYRMYVVAPSMRKSWQAAVSEAESLLEAPRSERILYFHNLYSESDLKKETEVTEHIPKKRGRKRKSELALATPQETFKKFKTEDDVKNELVEDEVMDLDSSDQEKKDIHFEIKLNDKDLDASILASVLKATPRPPITPRAIYMTPNLGGLSNGKSSSVKFKIKQKSKANYDFVPVKRSYTKKADYWSQKKTIPPSGDGVSPKVSGSETPSDLPPKRPRGRPRKSLTPGRGRPKKVPTVETTPTQAKPVVKTPGSGRVGRPRKVETPAKVDLPPVEQTPKSTNNKPSLPLSSKNKCPVVKPKLKSMVGFEAYCEQHADRVSDENPDLSPEDIEKYLERLWNEMPDNLRARYKSKVADDSGSETEDTKVCLTSASTPLAPPSSVVRSSLGTKRIPSLFAGIRVDRVCEICLKGEDVVKCRGPCSGYFHVACGDTRKTTVTSKPKNTESHDNLQQSAKKKGRCRSTESKAPKKSMNQSKKQVDSVIDGLTPPTSENSDNTEDSLTDSEMKERKVNSHPDDKNVEIMDIKESESEDKLKAENLINSNSNSMSETNEHFSVNNTENSFITACDTLDKESNDPVSGVEKTEPLENTVDSEQKVVTNGPEIFTPMDVSDDTNVQETNNLVVPENKELESIQSTQSVGDNENVIEVEKQVTEIKSDLLKNGIIKTDENDIIKTDENDIIKTDENEDSKLESCSGDCPVEDSLKLKNCEKDDSDSQNSPESSESKDDEKFNIDKSEVDEAFNSDSSSSKSSHESASNCGDLKNEDVKSGIGEEESKEHSKEGSKHRIRSDSHKSDSAKSADSKNDLKGANKGNNKLKELKNSDSENGKGKGSKWMCAVCRDDLEDPCFVCSKSSDALTIRCSVNVCGRLYHESCTESWPQAVLSKGFKGRFNLTCPQHACHTCISDNPQANLPKFCGDRLVRCLNCPTTYHHSNYCVPAGTEIISNSQIICPRHYEGSKMLHINASWCFICSVGGALICCEHCPNSFHVECLKIEPPSGKYVCEDCETGRYPLYGEIVWVKLGSYRWWPAKILYPAEVPENINQLPHKKGEFAVKFFGSHDHYWVNRGRTFLYHEGDGEQVVTKSRVDKIFNKAMAEASEAFERLDQERLNREAISKISHKPPKFVKIQNNKYIGNVKCPEAYNANLTPCDCKPESDSPCGPNSDCINRLLMIECNPQVCPAKDKCCNQNFEKRLYPPLAPFKTDNRGWGLKTLVPLKKGDFVIEYVGEMIDEAEYQRRLQYMQKTKNENYYFLTIDKDRMLDAGPKGNKARFMNHSCAPNCETQKWTVNGVTRVGLFTLQDIAKDTELVFNYQLETIGNTKVECKCGAPNCSGFIGGKQPPKIVEKKMKVKPKKVVKKSKPIKVSEESCFTCGEGGELLLCDNATCPKAYHLSCLGLTKQPAGGWVCPWHQCSVCSQGKVQRCTLCINSYCSLHAEGNISLHRSLGLVCFNHTLSDSGSDWSENESRHTSNDDFKQTHVVEAPETVGNSTILVNGHVADLSN